MKAFSFILLCLILQINCLAQNSYNLYVSPTGNNTNSGTSQDAPLASIEKARIAVQTLKKEGKFNQPIHVYLRQGTYYLQKPLVFTHDDSGTELNPITYTAYPGEQVNIHGGKTIISWKKYKGNIWVASVPEAKKGTWSFRQLYVNGKLKQRARIPNQGFLRVKGFPDGGPEVHYHTDCQRFEYAGQDINPAWTNLNDIEVIVYHFWTDSHLPVQSVDANNRIVTFKHKAGKVFTDDFTKAGARYVVENVWEGLDAPGEWYLNKKSGLLYYYPEAGEDMNKAEVIAPLAPAFIHLQGKPLENKPVAYLSFNNLNFEYTNFELPPGNSNDQQGSASVPAAITLSGAQHCTFENCRIQNIGTFAFEMNPGSRYNRIASCEMSYLAAGGIRVNGGNTADHPLLRTGYNQITDNLLHHYGEVFPSAVGILLMHTHHNEVLHNEIHHGWYTGVSVGWVWGYKHSISTHNLIAYNHIHHIGGDGLLSDMGGIYTLGVSPGTVLRNNLIHDVNANHYGGWGIYNDEGTTHLLIENNIVYNTKFAPYNIHFCKEVMVRNNIFALGKLEQVSRHRMEPHTSVYFENNIVYWKEGELFSQNWQDKSYTFHVSAIRPDEDVSSTFEANYNLYYNPRLPADSVKYNGLSFVQWQSRGKDKQSTFADPLFEDADTYDFRLKPGSPALQMGFQPIDMSRVGVRRKVAGVNKARD